MFPDQFHADHQCYNGRPLTMPSSGLQKIQNLQFAFEPKQPCKTQTFFITGCQGENNDAQGDVAGAMKKLIIESTQSPNNYTAGILCGDNIYRHGAKNSKDPLFETCFTSKYPQTIDWLALLGNHDWNFQHLLVQVLGRGTPKYQRAMAQVEHTYLGQDQWFMPYRYYVIDLKHTNLFILDSSTFYWDTAQQGWLMQMYKELNPKGTDKKNLIAMHHPLVSIGKRHPGSDDFDTEQYVLEGYPPLTAAEHKTTMNQLLHKKFIELETTLAEIGIIFFIDAILSAHDHFLAKYLIKIFKKKPTAQYILGGGGGKLQDMKQKSDCRFFKKSHGFLRLILSDGEIRETFVTIDT